MTRAVISCSFSEDGLEVPSEPLLGLRMARYSNTSSRTESPFRKDGVVTATTAPIVKKKKNGFVTILFGAAWVCAFVRLHCSFKPVGIYFRSCWLSYWVYTTRLLLLLEDVSRNVFSVLFFVAPATSNVNEKRGTGG